MEEETSALREMQLQAMVEMEMGSLQGFFLLPFSIVFVESAFLLLYDFINFNFCML